jgi:uncharacterized protein (TIGR02118 family)
MVVLTFVVRRRDDVGRTEFHRYWREDHGPLVRSFQGILGFRRYAQLHRLDTPFDGALRASRGAAEPYDGIAQVWWDSLEAMSAGSRSPEGRAATRTLVEDEGRFVDLARSSLWLNEEIEVASPPPGG